MKYICGLLMAISLAFATPAFADTFTDLQQKAESGDAAAQLMLAKVYLYKWDKHYNPAEGERWLLKAAEAGNADAEMQLGDLYVTNDRLKALGWYEKAATHGVVRALQPICAAYFYGGVMESDWSKVALFCQKAADNHIAVGLTAMGVAYAEGKGGLPVDQIKALGYLAQADGMNEPYAAEYLGRLNLQGLLVPQDYAKSAIYFRKAMGYGRMVTAAYLAQQYDKGLGVSAEPLEAARLYYFAASAGQSDAITWMAGHPEITEDSLKANQSNPFKDPPALWTSTVKAPDGGNIEAPLAQYMFSQLNDFYPDRAVYDEVEGSVTIDCHWNNEGNLDNCLVLHESPAGYGFAQATLRMLLRPIPVTQKDAWKTQHAGKSFHTMIRWVLG